MEGTAKSALRAGIRKLFLPGVYTYVAAQPPIDRLSSLSGDRLPALGPLRLTGSGRCPPFNTAGYVRS